MADINPDLHPHGYDDPDIMPQLGEYAHQAEVKAWLSGSVSPDVAESVLRARFDDFDDEDMLRVRGEDPHSEFNTSMRNFCRSSIKGIQKDREKSRIMMFLENNKRIWLKEALENPEYEEALVQSDFQPRVVDGIVTATCVDFIQEIYTTLSSKGE